MGSARIQLTVHLIMIFAFIMFFTGCGGGGGGSGTNDEEQSGTIVYVQPSPSDPSDGKTWASAFTSLQEALNSASSGDEIWVAAGTYKPGSGRSSSFTLNYGVAVYGGFNCTESSREERDWEHNVTILSGDIGAPGDNSDNCYHVITGASQATLDGFTITGGNADSNDFPDNCGGGMYNEECSPTVANCIYSGNSAGPSSAGSGQGGGMYNYLSSPTITNCIFTGNSSKLAGGGISSFKNSPTIANCTFSGNSSRYGGGMHNYESNSIVTNCTFSGNSAEISGGGIENYNCSPAMTGCTFSNNSAVYSGGMNNSVGSPTIINCTFSGNSAEAFGGGMFNSASSPTIINCTFLNNSSGDYGRGGGMSNRNSTTTIINCTFSGNYAEYGGGIYDYSGTSVNVINSILWGNLAGTSGNQIYNNINEEGAWPDSFATVTYSCVQDGTTDNHNINNDPLLTVDLILEAGSPCIDAGDFSIVPEGVTTDLAGNPRLSGNNVDTGAYEYQQ